MKENNAILVVDDTEANRYSLGKYLRSAGFEVWEAATGAQALQLARQNPMLITLDVHLPDMVGHEVCRRLKEDPATRAIPILEISAAYPTTRDKARGLESGADGYLSGPADPDELLANVRLLLRLRESQEGLRRSEAKFRQQAHLLELASDAIFVRDLQNRIQFWNRGAEELYGWTVVEALAWPLHAFLQTESSLPLETLDTIVRDAGAWRGELRHRCRDGRWVVVDSRWALQRDENGAPFAILEINRDITERKRAEEEVRLHRGRLQAVIDNAGAVIYMVDKSGRFLLVNRRFEELFQLGNASTCGKTLWEAFPSKIAQLFHANNQKVLAEGKPLEFEESVPHEGTLHTYISTKVPLLDASGTPYAVCGISTDITERKRTENELWQTTAELEQTKARLEEYAGELERKVNERTLALARANEDLRRGMAERNRIEQHREALLRQVVKAQEDERLRISRDLHDRTGQHLTALALGLTSLGKSLGESGQGRTQLHGLQKLTDEMGQELHRIASELRPTALDDVGLRSTLKNYVQEWSGRYAVKADFQGADYASEGVSPEIEITLYRVAQECLNNVVKHAAATRVSVILERSTNQAQLIIEDNGRGFDTERVLESPVSGGRLGLAGMKERLGFVGGTISVESSDKGTTVFARVLL